MTDLSDETEAFDADSVARRLVDEIGGLAGEDLLRAAVAEFGTKGVALVSSFGTESAVLLHLAARVDTGIPVIFIDTGKLFGETRRHRDDLVARMGLTDVRTVGPDAAEERAEDADGLLWRTDADACCALRKVRPLERALGPFRAWISGRKRFQGGLRGELPTVEAADGRVKLNPLAGWSRDAIAAYLDANDLPRHPLEADGFLSVGCMPCTDRVAPGENARDGRWRGRNKTECGIHLPRTAKARPTVGAPNIMVSNNKTPAPDHLDQLESQSIYILREARHRLKRLGLLWSLGKDSNVMIWLARKAFLGDLPFPVLHLDTGLEFPEAYEFRDRYAREWGLDLIADACPPIERTDPTLPPGARVAARKSLGLAEAIERYRFDGLIAGIRRDEQATRAKERVFSPRRLDGSWQAADQPPEFWDHYTVDRRDGTHTRVHPLLGWTELDVWRYIRREEIPLVPLYFARDGKRFRSLGEIGITFPVESRAATVDEIIAELEVTREPERAGRSMDHESEDAFERLRATGYL